MATQPQTDPRPLPPRDDPIWKQWAKRSPLLHGMLASGEPLTRDNWLKRNYMFDDSVPDPIPPEVEDMMPPPFRQHREED